MTKQSMRVEFKSWSVSEQASFLNDLFSEHAYYAGFSGEEMVQLDLTEIGSSFGEGREDGLKSVHQLIEGN